MGEFDYARGAYHVPANAAHAWVEVYFPDYGWVEFEPTAVRSPFVYQRGATPLSTATPSPRPATPNSSQVWKTVAWVAGFVGLLALTGAVWRLSRLREP